MPRDYGHSVNTTADGLVESKFYSAVHYLNVRLLIVINRQDLIKTLCDGRCGKHGQEQHNSSNQRKGSCTNHCFKTYIETNKLWEDDFPFLPGCANSIFEARYWLGQQDTPGTDSYSTIRCLRPQFRRLGLREWLDLIATGVKSNTKNSRVKANWVRHCRKSPTRRSEVLNTNPKVRFHMCILTHTIKWRR